MDINKTIIRVPVRCLRCGRGEYSAVAQSYDEALASLRAAGWRQIGPRRAWFCGPCVEECARLVKIGRAGKS